MSAITNLASNTTHTPTKLDYSYLSAYVLLSLSHTQVPKMIVFVALSLAGVAAAWVLGLPVWVTPVIAFAMSQLYSGNNSLLQHALLTGGLSFYAFLFMEVSV